MTKQTNGASPDLIVLGLGEQGKPQAARFPASQSDQVTKAATAMNLVVGKADGAALAELAEEAANWPGVRDWPRLRGPRSDKTCTTRLSSN